MTLTQKILRLFGKSPAQGKTISKVEPLLPSSANAISGDEVHAILQRYGVAGLLTPQDDPVFWATVLQHFWPVNELVEDAARFISPNFYFGIKEVVGRTTLEWSQASQIKTLRLTCSPDGHLRQQDSETADGQKHPSFSLAVSRPSVGVRSAWFEKRGQFGLTHGKGEIGVCRRASNGIWSEPDGLEYYKS